MKVHEDIAHFGVDKVCDELRKSYYFKNMRKFVKKCLANCVKCVEYNRKGFINEGCLHPIDKGTQPWITLHVDHVGPFHRASNRDRHIFEVIDAFSKFAFFDSCKSTSTVEVIKILERLFYIFGSPKRLVSDHGTSFTSDEFEDYCKTRAIEHVKIAVKSNG